MLCDQWRCAWGVLRAQGQHQDVGAAPCNHGCQEQGRKCVLVLQCTADALLLKLQPAGVQATSATAWQGGRLCRSSALE